MVEKGGNTLLIYTRFTKEGTYENTLLFGMV